MAVVKDDEIAEWRLRQRYPLLCERFLDGYSEVQVARGQKVTVLEIRIRIGRELRKARLDPMTKSGAGRCLVSMSDTRNQVRDVCATR